MNVGFTGTQKGMTKAQRMGVKDLLMEFAEVDDNNEFHYGACVGADTESAEDAIDVGYVVFAHPANDVAKTKRGLIPDAALIVKPAPALARDRQIVDKCQVLIAAPEQVSESLRSGTWFTIRYARSRRKPIIYVWPDGKVQR